MAKDCGYVSLNNLLEGIDDLKKRFHLSGEEPITDTTVITKEGDPEYPPGAVLFRIQDGEKYGTLSIAPRRLGEKLN